MQERRASSVNELLVFMSISHHLTRMIINGVQWKLFVFKKRRVDKDVKFIR